MPMKIKETKVTCKSCGNVWHYGKEEAISNFGDEMMNVGKDMSCCTGSALGCIPRKQTKDFNKCDNCGSEAVGKEEIINEV